MNFDVIDAVRDVLIAESALTDIVAAAQITTTSRSLPTVYPAITLSNDLIEDGNAYIEEGLFYIRIYTQNSKHARELSNIQKQIMPLLSRNGACLNISNDTVTVHEFRQVFSSEPIHEPDVDIPTWSMTTHYACKVTI